MPREKRIYLQHDLNARNDPKILELTQAMKGQGKAIWWDLIEMLWEAEGYLPYKPELIAYGLRYCTAKEVERVINDFNLFDHDDEQFWSNGVLSRLGKQREAAERRSRAGQTAAAARWDKSPSDDGNPAESPENAGKPEGPVIGESETVRRAMAKCGPTSRALLENYAGPVGDLEEFIRVFHFERNVSRAWEETAKFIKNYQPNGWCRKGAAMPVKDRIALARGWDIAMPFDKVFTNPAPLSYLNQVFIKLQGTGDPERWRLIFDIDAADAKPDPADNCIHFTYRLTEATRQLIERTGLSVEGIKIHYIVKQ